MKTVDGNALPARNVKVLLGLIINRLCYTSDFIELRTLRSDGEHARDARNARLGRCSRIVQERGTRLERLKGVCDRRLTRIPSRDYH